MKLEKIFETYKEQPENFKSFSPKIKHIKYKDLFKNISPNKKIFLFLEEEIPFKIFRFHLDKNLIYYYRKFYKTTENKNFYLPCLNSFYPEQTCPLDQISKEILEITYLTGIEYISQDNKKYFGNTIILEFKYPKEILDFANKLKELKEPEINYIILGIDQNTKLLALIKPAEQTIETAKKNLADKISILCSFVNKIVIPYNTQDAIERYKYRITELSVKIQNIIESAKNE